MLGHPHKGPCEVESLLWVAAGMNGAGFQIDAHGDQKSPDRSSRMEVTRTLGGGIPNNLLVRELLHRGSPRGDGSEGEGGREPLIPIEMTGSGEPGRLWAGIAPRGIQVDMTPKRYLEGSLIAGPFHHGHA